MNCGLSQPLRQPALPDAQLFLRPGIIEMNWATLRRSCCPWTRSRRQQIMRCALAARRRWRTVRSRDPAGFEPLAAS